MNKVAAMYNSATGQDLYYEYELNDIPELQEDVTTQAAGLSSAWWMTVNERREAMGLDELPMDGDTIYAPMGITPLADLTEPMTDEDTANKALHGYKY